MTQIPFLSSTINSQPSIGHVTGVNAPYRTQDFQVILLAVNNKTSLGEVGFRACVVVMATIAFSLMVGNAIWKSMTGKSGKPVGIS
jgi:hypothetical protein